MGYPFKMTAKLQINDPDTYRSLRYLQGGWSDLAVACLMTTHGWEWARRTRRLRLHNGG